VIRTLKDGYQTSRMRDATSRSVHTCTISRMEHACVNTSQMQCVHKGWVRGVFLYAYHENVHCDGTFLYRILYYIHISTTLCAYC